MKPSPTTRGRFHSAWLLVAAAAIHLPYVFFRRAGGGGDFDLGREMGRRFLAGEPLYEHGLHYPYPPAAAVFFAPLALFPAEVAFVARYLVAIGALLLTLRRLETADRTVSSRASLLTVVLAAHYVIRDLDDAGAHLILLAIAIVGLTASREETAAACLGFAGAVKPPYALLLPWLLWTRRWRLAAMTALALVLWTALPAARMGIASWTEHEAEWGRVALRSAVGNPIPGAEESERRVQNQSLARVVDRITRRESSGTSMWGMMTAAVLAVAAALRFRGPAAAADPGAGAAILLLAVLLSPVSWVQHFVVVIPALHRIVSRPSAAAKGALGVYAVLSLVLNRELLGREIYLALLAAGVHTACALLLLVLLCFDRRREGARRT